jgi:hypothetical protein
MTTIAFTTPLDQAADIMIGLARLTPSHPVIVGGADSLQILRRLRRRGFFRAVAASDLAVRRGPNSAALVAGDRTLQSVEASLAAVSPLLSATAAIVVAIPSVEKDIGLKIRSRLEQLGFRIEAGVRCQAGLLL